MFDGRSGRRLWFQLDRVRERSAGCDNVYGGGGADECSEDQFVHDSCLSRVVGRSGERRSVRTYAPRVDTAKLIEDFAKRLSLLNCWRPTSYVAGSGAVVRRTVHGQSVARSH